jgi:CysZ protein
LKLITQPDLRHFVWVPLVINFILYGLALWLAGHYFSEFMNWLLSLLPRWLDFIRWLLWPFFALGFLLGTFFSFTLVANLVGSPFYGRLSEKAGELATGRRLATTAEPASEASPVAGFLSETKRILYFLLRTAPLLILFLIPGLNLIAPFVWMGFNAWFLALEYTSYPLESQGILFGEQRAMLKNMRFGALAFGGLVMLGLAVPVLNILIPPAAVVGATLYITESRKRTTV